MRKRNLQKLATLVERDSIQPRFSSKNNNIFTSVYQALTLDIEDIPPYKVDSRRRDRWLRKFVQQEPFLQGILNSIVTINKNRGWELRGGARQVKKFTNVLHNYQVAPNISGWRMGISAAAQSFYETDLGCIVEIGRDEEGGPLSGLFHVDSARCRLSGREDTPLIYTPITGKEQPWKPETFFHILSMPNTDEAYLGLGMCAVSRCYELAKVMIAVYEHDKEKLGAKAPKGLLLLNGISEAQWEQSLEQREANLESMDREYYQGVQVLAGDGISPISASLLALSQLPENFDQKTFTDIIIYGYSLIFGYDPREFWPVSGGQLGTSMETEVQHKKATGKGGLDFILAYQERLQQELPDTIEFEFEQRDIDGELQETSSNIAKMNLINSMWKPSASTPAPQKDEFGNAIGTPPAPSESLITREEARYLMAELGLIPNDWTTQEEEVETSDTDDKVGRSRADKLIRSSEALSKTRSLFPDEPLVSYKWNGFEGKTTILWRPEWRK